MKRRLAVSLLLLVFVAAGAAWWFLRPTPITFLTDADTIREAATQASLREVLWQRPTPLLDLINDQADEFEPRVSRDGGTLFFVRGKPGHNADIFVCTRESSGWSRPAALEEINTPNDELGPEPSADGQSLYFYSDRPGGIGGYDLWVAHKGASGWQPPTNLGSAVNTAYNEYGPALSPDGRTFCFSTNRPKPGEVLPSDDAWRATVREDLYRHDYDLYAAKITDAGLQPATPLDALNSTQNDGAPAYSPIGDFLYFSSDRPGGQGGFDLYRSRIAREQLQPPANLGSAINTTANELDPALDVGGYALHFSSDRPTLDSATPPDRANPRASLARYHLYRSFSREVFHDVELRLPVIDWAGLWKQVGSNIMWALLALIVFILLLALMRDLSRRRLSLLARCLIVSLMIHMLLMLWFNGVKVTASIASAIRKSGPIQVALSGARRAGDLSIQIRGGLTQADVPPAEMPKLDRAVPKIAANVSIAPVEMPVETKVTAPQASSLVRARVADASMTRLSDSPRSIAMGLTGSGADFSLPNEPSRSNTSEKTDAAVMPVQTMPIGRFAAQVPTSQPAEPHPIDLAVEGNAVRLGTSQRIVANAAHSDSDPPALIPAFMQGGLIAATLGFSNTIEPTIPGAGSAPRQSASEGSSIPTVDFSNSPRAGIPTGSIIGSGLPSIQHLRPDAIANPGSQQSVVMKADLGGRDATPGFGFALPGADRASLGYAADSAAKDPGYGIDVALPNAGAVQKTSDKESAAVAPSPFETASSGSLTRAPATVSGAPGQTTTVELAPSASTSSPPGSQSLLAGSSSAGGGLANLGHTGAIDARLSISTSTGLRQSTALQTSSDPVALGISLPSETTTSPSASPALPAVGKIHGRVSDESSGERLGNARIQVDLPSGTPVIVFTDKNGKYELSVPELPDNFAISASKSGYLPKTQNVASRAVVGRSMRLNFSLQPQSLQVVALEDSPVVHHLGNDAYEGRINSQFQREAEGRAYSGDFELSADQLAAGQARIELMAKGVQCPHKIKVNGHLLEIRLDRSPEDGSFGSFTADFDVAWLQEGTNRLEIRGVVCNGDLDDFEFVNLRIRLLPDSR